MPHNGFETVRRFNEFLGTGGLEEAIALLDPEIIVREPPGLPYGGEYRGREGFRELASHLAEFAPKPLGVEYFDAGDVVIARMSARFSGRSGRSADVEIADVFRVRDGLITLTEVFIDDPAAIAALVREER